MCISTFANGRYLSVPAQWKYTVAASTQGQIYSGNNFGLYYPAGIQNLVIDLMAYTTVTAMLPAWYDISYYMQEVFSVNGHW